jgi:hypothetical protein
MISLSELREIPESRRAFGLVLLAVVIWAAALFLLFLASGVGSGLGANMESGDRIINAATVYRAYPRAGQSLTQAPGEDPMTVITEVVNTLGLSDRMRDLQMSPSGVSVQLDRLYGNELGEFLSTMESRGLAIRTAEIRVLPMDGERRLAVSLQMGRN